MDDETPLNPPAVFVNIYDADGSVIASEMMDYEVADYLRLRVDPKIAAGCKVVYLPDPRVSDA